MTRLKQLDSRRVWGVFWCFLQTMLDVSISESRGILPGRSEKSRKVEIEIISTFFFTLTTCLPLLPGVRLVLHMRRVYGPTVGLSAV